MLQITAYYKVKTTGSFWLVAVLGRLVELIIVNDVKGLDHCLTLAEGVHECYTQDEFTLQYQKAKIMAKMDEMTDDPSSDGYRDDY